MPATNSLVSDSTDSFIHSLFHLRNLISRSNIHTRALAHKTRTHAHIHSLTYEITSDISPKDQACLFSPRRLFHHAVHLAPHRPLAVSAGPRDPGHPDGKRGAGTAAPSPSIPRLILGAREARRDRAVASPRAEQPVHPVQLRRPARPPRRGRLSASIAARTSPASSAPPAKVIIPQGTLARARWTNCTMISLHGGWPRASSRSSENGVVG